MSRSRRELEVDCDCLNEEEEGKRASNRVSGCEEVEEAAEAVLEGFWEGSAEEAKVNGMHQG